MIPIIKRSAIFFLFLILPITAMAEVDEQRIIQTEQMRELFREAVTSDLPWDGENIRIKNFTVSQTNIFVPRGKLAHRIISLVPERFLGRRYLTVVYSVDGQDQAKIKMSGDVHRYANIFCSAGHLSRGTTLERDDFLVKYRDITMLGNELPQTPQEITGKVTRSSLSPGEIIYSRNLEEKELVKRGDRVTIIAGNGAVRISVPGEVENRGGSRGERVKVKNLMSRRIIHARVIEDGIVRAEL